MNLVVQGAAVTSADAAEIARITGARSAEQLGAGAYRLRGAARSDAVALWCGTRGLDCAWVPEGRRFADLRLLAMDMDSTLIGIECIDELGAIAGRGHEIAAITASAMRGELDYPESLRRRVGLLAGLGEDALERVYRERLRLSPGAERLVSHCRRKGVRLLLVSGGFSFFTERLRQRLGFDYTLSNELEIEGGKLSGRLAGELVDGEVKARAFREKAEALGAGAAQTVAIGDGANDLPMLAQAGYSIAYRAKPAVRARTDCAIDHCGLDAVINLFE